MKFRTFLWFVGPSMFLMLTFIALPLYSVVVGSFYNTYDVREVVEEETCTAGFLAQNCTITTTSRPVIDENGDVVRVTEFIGWESYARVLEPGRAWEAIKSFDYGALMQIDFWAALRFTLMFTFVTLPLVIGVGLAIALAVNNTTRAIRGPVIFVSLLPFILTPVIGSLSIYWLFVGDGILTRGIEALLERDIAMFAQAWTIELLMLFYRVWHVAPFAFVIFYAALQTVNQDTLESAIIDGASRFDRLRYVIVPHLMPLIVFIALIHLMDSYRVFDEIVGFRAQAYVISLQWLTFDFLSADDAGNRAFSRANASSMLTMVGIVLILIPLLRRTWRDHKGSSH